MLLKFHCASFNTKMNFGGQLPRQYMSRGTNKIRHKINFTKRSEIVPLIDI